MGFSIKRLNKYWRWIKNNRAQYKDNCLVSKEYAKLCRELDVALLLKKPDFAIDEIASRKHDWVLAYIADRIPNTLAKYKDMPAPENLNQPNPDIKVWSMWWQGEDKADKLFRMCIDSARRHTGEPVIVLDKDNYSQYIDIPEVILQKNREGKIALQHVCDFMVVSVLAQQGGFFTGATVWWSQDASRELLRMPFYTCRAVTREQINMSRSRWTSYLLAGNKEFPMFSFARDCLMEYWGKEDRVVDYLLIDYIFELAYQNIPCVREMIDALPEKNNMRRNELIEDLSTPYDPEKFKKYTQEDTFLYKLSWKFGKKDLQTSDGKLTNYGYMLKECGDRI